MTALTNEQRSAQEVARFMSGAHLTDGKGAYFAYQSGPAFRPRGERLACSRLITTWTGDLLARVTDVNDVFTSNMGDQRQNFRALGIDGRHYSGTAYLSAGDYVRMRAVKS